MKKRLLIAVAAIASIGGAIAYAHHDAVQNCKGAQKSREVAIETYAIHPNPMSADRIDVRTAQIRKCMERGLI